MPVLPVPPQERKRWLVSYLGDFYGHIINAFNIDLFSAQGKVRVGKKIYPHTLASDVANLEEAFAFHPAKINDGTNDVYKIWAVSKDMVLKSPAATLAMFEQDTSTGLGETDSGSDIVSVKDDTGKPLDIVSVAIAREDNFFHVTGEGNSVKWLQSFKTLSAPFKKLTLYIKQVGHPTDNLVIKLWELDVNGIPTGAELLTKSVVATTFSTAVKSYEFLAADFTPTSFTFDATKTYGWEFSRSGAANTTQFVAIAMQMKFDAADDVYTDGQLKSFNGTTWTRVNFKEIIDTFAANGTWTVPAGVTQATVEAWGAGGGSTTNVGAGGGGAYSRKLVTGLTPGANIPIVVGTSAANTDGGDSTFNTSVVVAKGGKSGANGSAGGLAADGIGDTKFSGGNGSNGSGARGGGGGAGDSADGTNGSASAGGIGGPRNGGEGGHPTDTPSTERQGRFIGGGAASGTSIQEVGARGEVRITYTVAVPADFPYVAGRIWDRRSPGQSLSLPPGVMPGELILAVLTSAGANTTFSWPGWTSLFHARGVGYPSGNQLVHAALYKRATGDDGVSAIGGIDPVPYVVFRIVNAGTPTATTSNSTSAGAEIADSPNHILAELQKSLWMATVGFKRHANGGNPNYAPTPPANYGSFLSQPDGEGWHLTAVCQRELNVISENPDAFGGLYGAYGAATIAIPFKEQNLFLDASMQMDVSFPAANERLFVSSKNDVLFLAKENTSWVSLWKGILKQDALDPLYPRILKVFGIGEVLLVANGSKLHSIARRAVSKADIQVGRLVFPLTHFAKWVVATKTAIFVGLEHKESPLLPSFIVYHEPLSEVTRMVENPEGTTVGFFEQDNCWLIDIRGQIKAWDGARFQVKDYMPTYFLGLQVTTLPHRNAFVQKDGNVHFLWNGQTPFPFGIWSREREMERIYHKGGFVFDRTNLNSFGDSTGTGGALYYDGENLLAGASIVDAAEAAVKGIFSDKRVGVSVSSTNRGWLKTAKIPSGRVNNVFRNLLVKYDPLREGIQTGKIKAKVRFANGKIAENQNAPQFSGTWSNATTFTCSDASFVSAVDAGNIVVGDEINVIRGNGAGLLAHIVSITGTTPKTVTIDEGLAVVSSGTCKFRVESWKLLQPSVESSSRFSEVIDLPENTAEWAQFKLDIRGEYDIEELQVGLRENRALEAE